MRARAPFTLRQLRRRMRRLSRDRRGVSAVEFAMILPLMITLYLGGVEVTQGVTIDRKNTMVTRAIGDLVSQGVNISNAEMNGIFEAARAVVSPYPNANLKMIVSSVEINGQGQARISWSEARNATARAVGTPVTLPQGLNIANTTLIWAESEYSYTPAIGYMITGTMPLKDQIYMRPRTVDRVTRVP